MTTLTKIAIHGAAGRMGQRLLALATDDEALTVVAAMEAPGHAHLGQDAGTIAGVGVCQDDGSRLGGKQLVSISRTGKKTDGFR